MRVVSEYDPEYWGFDTQAEWDAWQADMAKKDDDEFYSDLVRFCRDERNSIELGTIGHLQAEIAREMIAAEPNLRDP